MIQNKIKVSVVIPCYNVEDFVRSSIGSVVDQKFNEVELICVNDGSTDNTLKVLNEIRNDISIPMEIVDKDNGGASQARNRGLELATGEYIQFLDADDLLKPDKLKHQLDIIKKCNNKPDIIAAAYEQHFEGGRVKIKKNIKYEPWEALARNEIGITSSNLWKRESVESVGGWDKDLPTNNEHDLIFRMMKNGAHVCHDPKPLTIKREREQGALSSNAGMDHIKRKIVHWRKVYDYTRENELLNSEILNFILERNLIFLKRIFSEDANIALLLHDKLMPKNYKIAKKRIESGQRKTSSLYRVFYNTIGFYNTEILRKYIFIYRAFYYYC